MPLAREAGIHKVLVGDCGNNLNTAPPKVVSTSQEGLMRLILAWKVVSQSTLAQMFTQSSVYSKVSDQSASPSA